MTADHTIDALRDAWLTLPDGANGSALAEALVGAGQLDEAEAVYECQRDSGYFIGYMELAWIEVERGNVERADSLMSFVAENDDEAEGDFAAGVVGHWRWSYGKRIDAEPLLRRGGADHYGSARADLGHLLRATGRVSEAEEVLRRGVSNSEIESFLPLANMLDEAGHSGEAEDLYRSASTLGDSHSAFNLSCCSTGRAVMKRQRSGGGEPLRAGTKSRCAISPNSESMNSSSGMKQANRNRLARAVISLAVEHES
jgi:tetratricopeptide (TPR) repeat protein